MYIDIFYPRHGGHNEFKYIYHQTEYDNGFSLSENMEKHVLFRLASTMLIKKVMHISNFYPWGGGRIGFCYFEA